MRRTGRRRGIEVKSECGCDAQWGCCAFWRRIGIGAVGGVAGGASPATCPATVIRYSDPISMAPGCPCAAR